MSKKDVMIRVHPNFVSAIDEKRKVLGLSRTDLTAIMAAEMKGVRVTNEEVDKNKKNGRPKAFSLFRI